MKSFMSFVPLWFNILKLLTATFKKHTLVFRQASGTSRGVLNTKDSYFILLQSTEKPGIVAVGECGLLRGLSIDDVPDYEKVLSNVCQNINNFPYWLSEGLRAFPSIHFGLEMALLDLKTDATKILFPSDFTKKEKPILINGLIWMGEKQFMFDQIKTKLSEGWNCIKLKIGAIDFEAEMELLKYIRSQFSKSDIELRVDANGAFSPENALEKLNRLAAMDLHSIEQPIQAKQWEIMAELCEKTPLPIALDEELIGVFDLSEKRKMMKIIQPQYLIFKPSFIGGFKGTQEWIDLCNQSKTPWWMTSALESNIGLNAIAQWTATLDNALPQGLGTGQLYTNNLDSPLVVEGGELRYKNEEKWDLGLLFKD
jgi:L-alanine-DL-glutamate epimerase-like enolase superfamily enzyme